ncbi:Chromosome partitioning protein OS=Rhodanobacter lindaniclasticus OX=75310 GN=B1991_10865 PE=4 SV=1 [Rhodanobacter lindaniclasticus]
MNCWPSTSATSASACPARSSRALDLVLVQRPPGRAEHLARCIAPDGRLRLRHLLARAGPPLRPACSIDTQGARSVMLEMAVLACGDLALSPVTPEILAARELRRGTMQLLEDHRAVPAPGHRAAAAASAHQPGPPGVGERPADPAGPARSVPGPTLASACWPPTCRPSKPIRAPRRAACRCIGSSTASHRAESPPAALDTMRGLAGELFPQWQNRFATASGRPPFPLNTGRHHGERA